MTAAAEVGAALSALCPPGIGCAAVALDGELPPLWPGEEAAVAAARATRRREFAGGRAAARAALVAAGVAPAALPALPDRRPRWPDGVQGSIAHSASLAIAAAGAAAAWRGLGLDLEAEGQVGPDLASVILGPGERDSPPDLTAAFCAKEAVQKALFPVCRELLDFHDLSLRLCEDGFVARLQRAAGPVAAGTQLAGQLLRAGGHVIAAVFWPAIAARKSSPSFRASTVTS